MFLILFLFYVEVKTTVLLWHNSSWAMLFTFQRLPNFEDCHDSYYFTPIIVNSITCLVHPCLLDLVKQLLNGDSWIFQPLLGEELKVNKHAYCKRGIFFVI